MLSSKHEKIDVRKVALSRKEDEKIQRKEQKEIEIELKKEEAHTYLICGCVWLQIDLKEQQKGIDKKLGKNNEGLGLVQDQQNNKERRKSKTNSCTRKQARKKARKQKLANTKIHTYIKEPKRSRKRE